MLDKARDANMTKDSVTRAIQRGTRPAIRQMTTSTSTIKTKNFFKGYY